MCSCDSDMTMKRTPCGGGWAQRIKTYSLTHGPLLDKRGPGECSCSLTFNVHRLQRDCCIYVDEELVKGSSRESAAMPTTVAFC